MAWVALARENSKRKREKEKKARTAHEQRKGAWERARAWVVEKEKKASTAHEQKKGV